MEKQYEINGRLFTFVDVRIEAGIYRGYNQKRKKWAWLYPTFIQFEGESVQIAKQLS